MKTLVCGIGININTNPMDYPDGLRSQATSLYAVHGEELSLNEVSARVLAAIQRAYRCCTEVPECESLATAWAPLDALKGRQVTARIGQQALSGLASGIDDDGALRLSAEDGLIHCIRAGDVTLRHTDDHKRSLRFHPNSTRP